MSAQNVTVLVLRRLALFAICAVAASMLPPSSPARTIAAAAKRQVGVTRVYDASYAANQYPGGDV